ncbi:immunoglobulin lambda-1 light chain-like [Ambystoma mexicanum]|uniref:immunoglobulin lambda-1 light chain-like n=1 Tax=Ambystoma mexicanum TaxID=8296 RepID=UPI0037E78EDB
MDGSGIRIFGSLRKMGALNLTAAFAQLMSCLLLMAPPFYDCSSVPQVLQPLRASFAEGSLAILTCTVQEGAIHNYNILWFQTKPSRPPANILRHGKDGNISRIQGFTERFQAIRVPRNNSHLLQIQGVQTDDSAIYWCMVESGNFSNATCGNGTRLSVFGGRAVMKPSVTLLTSDQDPSTPLFYILCLVNNFYPGVLEVTWKINGHATTREATTASLWDNEAYYNLGSLLELPNSIWRDSPSISCEVRHDSSNSVISKSLLECNGF